MAKDYYAALGVSRGATDDEIKQAFRRLAHQHHPDKTNGDSQKFKEINEAYQVLGNKERRQKYDQFGSGFETLGREGGFSWQDMYRGGESQFSGFEGFSSDAFDAGDIGDILGGMFGFGSTRERTRSSTRHKGENIEVSISITFAESYTGTEKKANIGLELACQTCAGSGNDPKAKISKCGTCSGSGFVSSVRSTFLGSIQTQAVCTACNGTGERADKKCPACKGSTLNRVSETINIHIPAGVDNGTTLRLSAKGNAGMRGGARGDLFVRIHVDPDSRFKREGSNILSREEVPLSVLISGGTIETPTPTSFVRLKVPAQTPSGKVFILHGKGFEHLTARGRGDLLIGVHAKVPKRLDSKQRKLLEELERSIT